MTVYIVVIGIVLCVGLSGFCSATEMTYSSCNTIRLENAKAAGSKRAAAAVKITEHYDDALSAILIGNNLANIAASSLSSVLVMLLMGGDEYTWVATVILTIVIIIFSETIPKISAKKNANRLSLEYAYAVTGLIILLKPVVWVVVGLIHLLTSGLKGESGNDSSEEAVEELQSIIETAEDEEVLNEEQSELVQAAIDFSEIPVYEVMTARVDVQAIDIDDKWEDIRGAAEDEAFSRLPVYEGSIDNIIGVLYLNHFLKALTENEQVDIRSLLMPPCYVYKTMKLPAVLNQLRKAKQHLAIVADEYGGMLGVVSMEDVLEQIVGEIWDENDEVEPEVVCRAEGEYELDGDMVISDFLELTGIEESSFDADSDTVGGWTVEMFGAFPKEGDSFIFRNIKVSVLSMEGRRVASVLVKINKEEK